MRSGGGGVGELQCVTFVFNSVCFLCNAFTQLVKGKGEGRNKKDREREEKVRRKAREKDG